MNTKAAELSAKGYVKNGYDIDVVANARDVGASRILLEACEKRLEILRDILENRSRIIVEGDYKKDFRYLAGEIAGIKWVLEFPNEAKKAIEQIKNK